MVEETVKLVAANSSTVRKKAFALLARIALFDSELLSPHLEKLLQRLSKDETNIGNLFIYRKCALQKKNTNKKIASRFGELFIADFFTTQHLAFSISSFSQTIVRVTRKAQGKLVSHQNCASGNVK